VEAHTPVLVSKYNREDESLVHKQGMLSVISVISLADELQCGVRMVGGLDIDFEIPTRN